MEKEKNGLSVAYLVDDKTVGRNVREGKENFTS